MKFRNFGKKSLTELMNLLQLKFELRYGFSKIQTIKKITHFALQRG
jgi:DNA-directed RNA polymerase alpha subunit